MKRNIKEKLGRKSKQRGTETDNKILSLLQKQPLTFGDLQKDVKVSKPVLLEHLKKLQKWKLVRKELINDKLVWNVTSKAVTVKHLRQNFLEDLKRLQKTYHLGIGIEAYGRLQELIWLMEKTLGLRKEMPKTTTKNITTPFEKDVTINLKTLKVEEEKRHESKSF